MKYLSTFRPSIEKKSVKRRKKKGDGTAGSDDSSSSDEGYNRRRGTAGNFKPSKKDLDAGGLFPVTHNP